MYVIIIIMSGYSEKEAKQGLEDALPSIDTWPNQYSGYDITIVYPEFSSVCPKTGLPDTGKITIRYRPARECVELKSLKYYFLGYRNLGIFYENAVNRILRDFVAAVKPERVKVTGEFTPRGGMRSVVECEFGTESNL